MAKAVVSRLLSVHKEHEVLLKLETAGLGEDEAQAIVDSKKNTLASTLVEIVRAWRDDKDILDKIKELLSSNKKSGTVSVGRYADEEVSSSYGYLSGYIKPKSVADQLARLRKLFPDIEIPNPDESLTPQNLSSPVEGIFTYLPWELVAPTYGEAVEKAFALLKQAYGGKFTNYREGQLGPKFLRESDRKKEFLGKLREQQKGNTILLIPAQFGILHRGRSGRRARVLMEDAGNEFGLGAWEIAIMLLTHPERLQRLNDLWIDGVGDDFAPGGDGVFSGSVYFSFDDGQLEFGRRLLDNAFGHFGSASGFVPLASSPS